jgi:hypothetical protein
MTITAGTPVVDPSQHRTIEHEEMVGKTISALGHGSFEGPYGEEPTLVLFFSDATTHQIILPED